MLYLDTSFIAPLVLNEATSEEIETFVIRQPAEILAVSQWTRVEFASLVAREVRMKNFTLQIAGMVLEEFEALINQSCQIWLPHAADYELARKFVTNFESGLRGGDALHLAIAKNQGASLLLTLDESLLNAAGLFDIPASRGSVAGNQE
ncbi:MAG TPA: type II toxin-antitoxin system VapC family toxin [Burkholderiales bacterium]|nr:type II toxin-antitoxin system VapC family toxin [Burkholderiales bacterium]